MTTAIIGTGGLGSVVARALGSGGETLRLSSADRESARKLAAQVGHAAVAAADNIDALQGADAVVLALRFSVLKSVIDEIAGSLPGKLVVVPSNPLTVDAAGNVVRVLPKGQSSGEVVTGWLPAGARLAMAFGTMSGDLFESARNRSPEPAVLFYVTDDDRGGEEVERLIRTAGFEPVKAGGIAQSGRLEVGGDLHNLVVGPAAARSLIGGALYSFPIVNDQGFGAVLRGHRRAARLTLEQLAEVSGVSARTLSDMERGRSKGPQHRTVTALADALALEGADRAEFVELARDGRLRDHWTRPVGLCEVPRLVDDFTGRAAELIWISALVYAESVPGAGVAGLITGSGGMGKTTLAIRAAHVLRPSFPGGVFFLDLLGMSPQPVATDDALLLLLRALGVADEQIPGDVPGRASVYRSLLRDRRALVVLDNAGSEEQVRPLLPGDGASLALITAKRLLAGLEGVRRLTLGPLSLPEATELLTGIVGQRAARGETPALIQLAQLCDGMPLALRIIGNRLLSRPGWDAVDLAARLADEEHRLDQFKAGDLKIATAFWVSYEQLADAARRVFRRLAVVPGRDYDAALAAVVAEVPVAVAWDALDELVDLGLLHDSAQGRYRFHDLVRLFARTRLEEEESPSERAALTARVTSWLLRTAVDDDSGTPGTVTPSEQSSGPVLA
jgi:predicted dinucleotide-binding enzyme/transcriptional regulator with XRE-family HTH domain